jgi:hypothetical protein
VRCHPGVYVLGGAAVTRESDLWAGLLAVGPAATLTHETSALIHGAERLSPEPITLTVPHRWHHDLTGLFVHQIDDLHPRQTTRWRGLPISRPARSVVELAATQPAAVIGRVADDLIAARVTTLADIQAVFASVVRPGKPGMSKLATILEERGEGYTPPGSELERAMFEALAAGGLPAPVRQVPLPGRSLVRGLADAAYLDAKIVLEADGRRWHNRMEQARVDRARDAQVVRAGWVPIRFVYEQIVHDPAEVCAVVEDTRSVRLGLLHRSAA